MRFTFRALLVCVAISTAVDAFVPSLRTAPSVRPLLPSGSSRASLTSNNKFQTTNNVLASSVTADDVPVKEPESQGTGTATISQ